MNRKEKHAVVSSVAQSFNTSEGVFVLSVSLNAQKTQLLRKKLVLANANMLVAKNTLLRLVAQEVPAIQPLAGYFKNQVAIVFASQNAPAIAAIIKESGKDSGIQVHSGLLDGQVIGSDRFEFVASIPSKPVLQAQLCGVLLAPIAKLVYVLKAASEQNQ